MTETLVAADPSHLTDAEVAEAVLELDRVAALVDAARWRVTAAFDARAVYGANGAVSPVQWLKARCNLRPGEAAAQVKFARLGREFPATAGAAATLGTAKVRVLLSAVNRRTRDHYVRDEAVLLAAAAEMDTVADVEELMRRWAVTVDQDGPAPHVPKGNEVSLQPTLDGRWHLRGELDAETGATMKSALEERGDRMIRAQRNCPETEFTTPQERAGEAFALLLRDALNRTPHDDDNLEPAFTVIMDIDDLEAPVAGLALIPGLAPMRGDSARRLACDCGINRLIMKGASQILDAGRTTHTVNRAQRRALVAPARGCGWPGCDMPPGWTDAHHIVFWGTQDGPTDIDLLILLCRRHHTLVHEGHWTIERIDGEAVVHNPDGILLGPPRRSLDPDRPLPDWLTPRSRPPDP